jgi:hypothetical protein
MTHVYLHTRGKILLIISKLNNYLTGYYLDLKKDKYPSALTKPDFDEKCKIPGP